MTRSLLARTAAFAAALFPVNSPAAADKLETRSTYHCLSIYWTRPIAASCTVQYKREVGETTWNRAQDLYWDGVSGVGDTNVHLAHQGQFKGSIVNLKPGVRHRIRLSVPGEAAKEFTVSTRADNPPTAGLPTKAIPTGANVAFATDSGGNEASWQVYDGGGGAITNNERGPDVAITVRHSKVIVRNITISGARKNAIVVAPGVSDVIIERCDLSNWGRTQAVANNENGPNGRDWDYGSPAPGDVAIGAQDGAIIADKTRRVTIQHCRIHHPRYRAAVWQEFAVRFGHPHGPFALRTGTTDNATGAGAWEGNHVIRFNEFYSDANKPFEDTLGLGQNFSKTGFPGPDSDLYGNLFRHCADDAIEADGGNCNVRVWGNYFDACYSRLSHQCSTIGPSYFFRNVIARGYGPVFNAIKKIKPAGWPVQPGFEVSYEILKLKSVATAHFNGPLYVYHNTSLVSGALGIKEVMNLYDTKKDNPPRNIERVILRNNVWVTTARYIADDSKTTDWVNCLAQNDLHNKANQPGVDFSWVTGNIAASPIWAAGSGTYPTSDPLGADTPTPRPSGFYQLRADSLGYHAGVAIPNFNRGDHLPDVGAHESGAPALQFGVGATWNSLE